MTAVLAFVAKRPWLAEAQVPCIPDVGAIAADAVRCLLVELETWPKPGLVSNVDPGSHDDMDADTFRKSAAAIAPYKWLGNTNQPRRSPGASVLLADPAYTTCSVRCRGLRSYRYSAS